MSEKQWYAVYTRARWEKKVADLLTRKDIENYCPLNRVKKQWADRKKMVLEPLFTSYVFVKVAEKEHVQLKKTDGVINLVYWLGKPAVIREVEIDTIHRFLGEHQNIKLEKTPVNINDMVRVISGPLLEHEGQVVAVKSKTIKIILPSLGYMMSAEIETAKVEVINERFNYYPGSKGNVALG
jgi:transcription antitermination factor NusG